MEPWIDAVSRVGFPAVIALFVLVRLNGKVDRLVEAITSLERALNHHLSRDDVKAIIRSYLNLDVPRDPDDKGC